MKIAFFTNHCKTEFFHALSPMLVKMGHEIYWISTSRTWAHWLKSEGVDSSRLLDLTSFGPEWTTKEKLSAAEETELAELEKSGGLRINNLIIMDRLLSRKPHDYARTCLSVSAREIRRFLIDNIIVALFSEATWAQELIAIQVCREIGCRHYAPHSVRIPSGRFGFFQGHTQSSLLKIREPNDDDRRAATEFYDYYLQKNPRPEYWQADCQPPRPRLNWLKKLRINIRRHKEDPYDEMQPSPRLLIWQRLAEVYTSRRLACANLFDSIKPPPQKPYILHTLHVQPEASIDVFGSYTSNQLELARALARSIPVGHDLFVKEHQVALGTRPLEFYRRLKAIPGVRLIDPFSDSHSLCRQASVVVTLSGTIAYEAALYGIPAMTVVPMFFGPILTQNGFNPFDESAAALFERLLQPDRRPDVESIRNIIDFLSQVYANSFTGVISDPRNDPGCMRPNNIKNVAKATNIILKLVASKELAARS